MFLTISRENITTLLGYISGLVGDLMPIILIALSMTIGLYVFRKITK